MSREKSIILFCFRILTFYNVIIRYKELENKGNIPFISSLDEIMQKGYNAVYTDKTISSFEIEGMKDIGKARMLIKFGPILGLMGTLIPMGPARAGLSSGDISSMAYNMQVAFATTVLGLFIGAVGFVLLQIRQRWLNTDLTRLDFVAGLCHRYFSKTPANHE